MSVETRRTVRGRRSTRLLVTGAAVAALVLPPVTTAFAAEPVISSARAAVDPGTQELRNLLAAARTSQSSTQGDRIAEYAQDGDTDGGSVALTGDDENAWWGADLGAVKLIERLDISQGSGASQQLDDFYVLTSTMPFASEDLAATLSQPGVSAEHVTAPAAGPISVELGEQARHMRIQSAGTGPLALAEVQAFGDETLAPSDGTAEGAEFVAENQFGMFLHYGMGTMTNVQWADPNTPASAFNPGADVDPAVWTDAMTSAGMDFGVLTAKHHDGHALWPTRYSDYSIANSPYQGGEGDLVGDYVQAMRDADLSVGLYFSIWDRHNGEPVSLIKNQLREILTRYGTIDYLWFDGWGWHIPYSQVEYAGLREFIHQVSPETVVANNDHFSDLATTDVLVWEVPVQGFPPADDPRPKDASDTLDANSTWFHTTSTGAPKSARAIVSSLNRLNAGNSLYLLNVGPDKDGSIPASHLARLAEIGEMRQNPPGENIAVGKPATQSSTYTDAGTALSASRGVDGNFSTFAHTNSEKNAWWQLDLGAVTGLSGVELYNRTDCCTARNTDYYLFISKEPFDTSLTPEQQAAVPGVWSHHDTGQMAVPTSVATPVDGRYVMVQLAGTNYLALPEVAVYPTTRTLDVSVEATARCLGGKAFVTVRARNNEDVPAAVTFESPFGTKSFAAVAPDASAVHSFTTRAVTVAAGAVSVEATATVGGAPVTTTTDAAYASKTCGG
ncbi:hypothetical protein ESP57_03125 [Agromyces fucosus]|uniref:alpha-L-fucosidase n=1 Tax=Agromyces fucosus TaxID=41985 RepID=A0A4Q2JU33_9MICO|nr:hypothetical protein ESP57_03125 [Agromyces fucosus]